MVKKRKKQRLSNAERARRRRQALINFGYKRKKRRGARTMAKRKSYRRSSGMKGILGNLTPALMGSAGVVAYESFLSPMIPLQGTAKDLLELALGAWLSKKSGFIGHTGKAMLTINAYQLVSNLLAGKLLGIRTSISNGGSW